MMTQTGEKIVTKIEANPLLSPKGDSLRTLNVAAYCRVSTDDEDQLNSYEAQVAYYTEYITKNPKWHFVDIYADEGISGTGVRKRKDFQRMLRDCDKGKIDLVLTKSVSRFARNTVDSLEYIRRLKAKNIGIFFEEQNCNTLQEDSEMILGIYSVIAQTESENISANVKWGIQKRMRNGTYHTRMNMLGYRQTGDDDIVIIPEEAETVRKIYSLYLDGYSIKGICTYLEQRGFKTVTGSCKWSNNAVAGILANEKYVGDILYQKTYMENCITKKAKVNNGEMTKYLVSNHHSAIVSRDIFKAVQLERTRRTAERKKSSKGITGQGQYSSKYVFSEILVCGECGSHMKRRIKSNREEKVVYWRCLNRTDNGKSACPKSKGIKETDLQDAVCRCLKKVCSNTGSGMDVIRNNLKYALNDDANAIDIFAIEQSIKEIQADADRVMMLRLTSGGNAEKYDAEITKMYEQIKILREKLAEAKELSNASSASKESELIERELSSISGFEKFDDRIVRKCVSCIKVNSDSTIMVCLKTGEVIIDEITTGK